MLNIVLFECLVQTGLSRHSEAMIKALQLRDGMKEQMAQMQEDLAAVCTGVVIYICGSKDAVLRIEVY